MRGDRLDLFPTLLPLPCPYRSTLHAHSLLISLYPLPHLVRRFKVNFATGAAPSTGLLSVEGDREFIKYHEKFILELLALAKKDKEVLRGLVKKEQLAGLNMTAEHAPVLLEACKATPHVQSMNLEGNCMGPEGGGVLAELLANDMWARHLKQLTLDGGCDVQGSGTNQAVG